MPTSKLKEVYSMLAEWETKAKELAKIELLSQSKERMEARAKQLFEGIAFDQLGEEDEISVDTTNVKANSLLDTELALATGDTTDDEITTDEPLPTNTTIDSANEFDWDNAGITIEKDKDNDNEALITIDAASLAAAVKGNPDTAPASELQCTCPIHGGVNTNDGPEPKNNTIDNEVIDMTQEPDMDAILESFIALSENADENEVEIVSETCDNEMEELTEEELKELDENMDGDAMMKALQEAFMFDGGNNGGFKKSVNEEDCDDDEDCDSDDKDCDDESTHAQMEIGRNMKKAKGKVAKMTKYDLGELDENCDDDMMDESDMPSLADMHDDGKKSRQLRAATQNSAAESRREASAQFFNSKTRVPAEKTKYAAKHKDDSRHHSETAAKLPTGGKQHLPEEDELEEGNQRTLANGKNQTLKPQSFPKNRMRSGLHEGKLSQINKKVEAVLAENKRLKAENKEISTLNEGLEIKLTAATEKMQEVKGKLYEASIIASKSTCMNKLFLEHVTTQDEKIDIVQNFGKAVSRVEVNNLFEKFDKFFKKGTSTQLNESRNPISKLNPLFKTEQSTQKSLNEGAIYDNSFTDKMNHLINYGGKK